MVHFPSLSSIFTFWPFERRGRGSFLVLSTLPRISCSLLSILFCSTGASSMISGRMELLSFLEKKSSEQLGPSARGAILHSAKASSKFSPPSLHFLSSFLIFPIVPSARQLD